MLCYVLEISHVGWRDVAFGILCSCSSLQTAQVDTQSSPLHLHPNQLLFIVANSPFGIQSYGWRGDKNAGKINRWQVALQIGQRELLSEDRNENTGDNKVSRSNSAAYCSHTWRLPVGLHGVELTFSFKGF